MTIINRFKRQLHRTGFCLAALTLAFSVKAADEVFILAKPTSSGYNSCPTWCEQTPTGVWSGTGSSSHSTASGDTAAGCTFAFTNTGGVPKISIQPSLANSGPGYCYTFESTHISGNCSPDIIVGITVTGAKLVTTPAGTNAVTQTTGFNSVNGINVWYTNGYLTNITTKTPTITLTYLSGTLASTGGRFYTDGYHFLQVGDPCENTPKLTAINGPLAANQTFVNVPNVSTNATLVTVYSDDGTNQSAIGSVAVTNVTSASVPTSALVKGRHISATQTVGGQEGCTLLPGAGALVGGGANPALGLGFCLNMQQDSSLTGPIGATGNSSSSDLYFLGASGRMGGFGTAPSNSIVLGPSTCWQTVYINPSTAHYFHWNNTPVSSDPDTNHFAELDALAIAIQAKDTGPYEIYIDNLMNGDTMVESWEEGTNNQVALGFSQPSFSSTTSALLLAQSPGSISPNISTVTTNHADSGSKALHVNWQFVDTSTNNWVRLNAAKHPQLDLRKPISFRVLILPVGVTNGDMNISSIADQTQSSGGSATFTVSANGDAPFSYQWIFNDTNIISGATNSSYALANLITNNTGHYTVAVSDANGCTNYSSANLTVNQVTITRVNITIVDDGTNVTLTWPGSHTLQSAPAVTGPYTDVSPTVHTGPYQVAPGTDTKFYRLRN